MPNSILVSCLLHMIRCYPKLPSSAGETVDSRFSTNNMHVFARDTSVLTSFTAVTKTQNYTEYSLPFGAATLHPPLDAMLHCRDGGSMSGFEGFRVYHESHHDQQ
ncbi:hypothetical protein BKA67DRAFT_47399 [Truncatella angustata]|uniref:Uncharacterized protein n=1 Tax=Truncatella angustata TaxID=152316 RepID=A0A9P8UY35_9PEZI|nr:uncharacterized protein BKA67DRAFT_47399 [Truncatella angustata]KAH6660308.1 hypothetical protein BKA67DRAFT_47399 [Truncatella angustata]